VDKSDTGSAIKGDRIDVYLGPKSNMEIFRSTALCRTGYVEVYVLE
jgi:3D (Asp-Asp-Asp) domain-containing protein